ncbi:M23 family metallopeptidase [Nesterenkonia sandarakina]|nr:M23 family metallopeptidase [Nesterenkonia sandarakina]
MINPKTPEHETHVMSAPVRGRWAALNTPGQQLPSHGTRFLGQYSAVDILLPSTPETPAKVRRAWRNSKPQEYLSFGEPVYAMADGVVVRTKSRAADHRARNTWQGLAYLMTLEGIIRSLGAPGSLFGNHVLVEHDDGAVAAYAHLRKGSLLVEVGQRVSAGKQLGEIGNSGNSSEPHLHVHLMDRVNPHAAAGLTMTWDNIAESGGIEPSLAEVVKDPAPNAIRTMPRNGDIFHA